jgi:hypothetical protein
VYTGFVTSHLRFGSSTYIYSLRFRKWSRLGQSQWGFMSVSCTLNTAPHQQNFTFCMKPFNFERRGKSFTMVKPLGTISHALETVWNPHWDTNRVSPCNYAIKPYNKRGCATLEPMKLCSETMHWGRHLFHTKVSHLGNWDGETLHWDWP